VAEGEQVFIAIGLVVLAWSDGDDANSAATSSSWPGQRGRRGRHHRAPRLSVSYGCSAFQQALFLVAPCW